MSRIWRRMARAALLPLALAACKPPARQAGWAGWERVPPHAAAFFQVWERGADRLLITFGPGGETDTTGLFAVADGGGPGLPRGAVRLPRPLGRVALLSTTQASFIAALGRTETVVGCAHPDRLRDPHVRALADAGKIAEIGGAGGLDREKVLMLAPQALFAYPYGAEVNVAALGRLPVIPVAEYLERDPLGRAEWVRAFGVLLGEEERAAEVFDGIVRRYEQAKAGLPVDTGGPKVFFGSSWKGTWSVPPGNSYMAQLIRDAGGRYLYADRQAPGNIDLDLEQVLQGGRPAACWGRILDLERPVTKADVAGEDGRILALPVFQGHGVFYANSRESDLFGQAGLEPDVILLDLIGIFHPALRGGREPVYFKPVQAK